MIRSRFVGCWVLSLLLILGCKKAELNRETSTTEDHVLAESLVNDLYSVALEAIEANEAGTNKTASALFFLGECAVLESDESDSTDYPRILTVTFDPEGCLGSDGRRRYGQISISIYGLYQETNTRFTIIPTEYQVDNVSISGQQWVENLGPNIQGNLVFSHEVRNVKVVENGFTVSYDATRTREWKTGRATTLLTSGVTSFLDDEYAISGLASGVSKTGRIYHTEVVEALVHRLGCRWFVEGVLDLDPKELKTRIIDFGSGSCDNIAEVEIGDENHEVEFD